MQKTPARVVLRHRLRLTARNAVEYEETQEGKRATEKAKREAEAARNKH